MCICINMITIEMHSNNMDEHSNDPRDLYVPEDMKPERTQSNEQVVVHMIIVVTPYGIAFWIFFLSCLTNQ